MMLSQFFQHALFRCFIVLSMIHRFLSCPKCYQKRMYGSLSWQFSPLRSIYPQIFEYKCHQVMVYLDMVSLLFRQSAISYIFVKLSECSKFTYNTFS